MLNFFSGNCGYKLVVAKFGIEIWCTMQLPSLLSQIFLSHPLVNYFLLYFIQYLRLKVVFFHSQLQPPSTIVSGAIS